MRNVFTILCLTLSLQLRTAHTAVLQDNLLKPTGLWLVGFQPDQEQRLTIYLNSLFLREPKGFSGTPLHQRIFAGPVGGETYRKYVHQRIDRVINIGNRRPGDIWNPKGALLIESAFFRHYDRDQELDFFKHLSRLLGGINASQSGTASCYAFFRFLGISGECVASVDDGAIAGLVFLYNMALSENSDWHLAQLISQSQRDAIVNGARAEIHDDLQETRFSAEWTP